MGSSGWGSGSTTRMRARRPLSRRALTVRRPEADAVATLALGAVGRVVGSAEQVGGPVLARRAERRDPDAHRRLKVDRLAGESGERDGHGLDRPADPLAHRLRPGGIKPGQEHDELFPAEAEHRARARGRGREAP